MQIESRQPGSKAQQDARLLADLGSRRPSALTAIITRFGSELTAVAYLVLQHHDGATDAVARGIADVWRRADDPAVAPDIERLRTALLGATARRALRSHGSSQAVDPSTDGTPGALAIGLSPPARAAFALRHVAGLDQEVVAALLEISPWRLRRLLLPAAAHAARLPATATELAAIPMTVDADRVRAALQRPLDRRASRRPWLAAAPVVLVLLLLRLTATPDGQPSAGDSTSRAGDETGGASRTPVPNPRAGGLRPAAGSIPVAGVAPFTLADCNIEPVGSPIAFAGWVTVEEIGATGVAPPGQLLYAIVTRGEAEWIGYRLAHGGPVFPRPVGRLGCVLDPASGTHTAIGVAPRWEPPTLADGCPGSPIGSFAGYRELGGPGAFVVIDALRGWRADDPDLSFLARVAPAPPPGAQVDAWLQPVGPGSRLTAAVDSPSTGADASGSVMHYVQVSGAEIPEPGCWILNIAVDGTVVGSAVLPIAAGSTPAS